MLDKNFNKPTTKYESLEDLNLISLWSKNESDWSPTIKEEIKLISLWSQSGSDWTSIIKEEIQADTNQLIAEEESNTSKVVLFGVLATLALLVAAMCSQASEIYRSVQEVGINSFKELISKD